jgi:hypothetical protein
MIDETTGQELQTVQPTMDEAQQEQDAQIIADGLEEIQPTELPEEQTAGLANEVSKFVSKMVGKETASDVSKVVGEQVAKEVPKYATPVKKADFANIAKKIIAKEKAKPLPPKPVPIGEKVQLIKKAPLTPEAKAQSAFSAVERGSAPVFNDINPEKEMLGLKTSSIDEFSSDDAWQLNFDTILDNADIQDTLAYMAEANQGRIMAERGEVGTDENILALAKEAGADPQFLTDVLTRESGGALPSAGYVIAARQMLDSSATRLRSLAMKEEHELSPKDRAAFISQYNFHVAFQSKYMGIRADLSRAFRAIGIDYKQEDSLTDFLAQAEAGVDVKKLREMIRNSENTTGINDVVNKYSNMGKYTKDMVFSAYMGSMLSGLGTQTLVLMGNTSQMVSRGMERKIASWLPKGKNAADEVMQEEFDMMMLGYRSSFLDGWKAMTKTLKTGEAYKGITSFGEFQEMPVPSIGFKIKNPVLAKVADAAYAGQMFMLRNVMGGTDAFFTVINERAELLSLAYREAKGKVDSGLLTPEQFATEFRSLVENPTTDIAEKASSFAREIGMREQTGEIANKIKSAVNAIPTGRYMMTFINTLSNQTRQTLGERVPTALLRKQFREDLTAGGSRQQLAYAKLGLGTGILATAFGIAENGGITGAYPNDKPTRDAWKAAGIMPYSFVFDNDDGTKTYVSYQGLEPFATPIGIAASLVDNLNMTQYQELTKDDEQKFNNIFGDLLYAVSETTLNKTMATGLQSFFDATQSAADAERLVQGMANNLIPMAGMRRNIIKEVDEIKRSTNGLFEYIQSQIPGLSEDLPPVLDIFGEDQTHKINMFRWKPLEGTDDPVRLELNRLNETVGRMAMPDFRTEFGGQGSTPKERAEWTKFARKDFTDEMGRTLHDVIQEDIMNSDFYNDLSDFDKVQAISSMVRSWDNAALQVLQTENEALYDKITSRKAAQKAMYILKENQDMTSEDALQQARDLLDEENY